MGSGVRSSRPTKSPEAFSSLEEALHLLVRRGKKYCSVLVQSGCDATGVAPTEPFARVAQRTTVVHATRHSQAHFGVLILGVVDLADVLGQTSRPVIHLRVERGDTRGARGPSV